MTSKHPYDPAKFGLGSMVRIADRDVLEDFLRTWTFHHPLEPRQLDYAGHTSRVMQSYIYHGGEVLYELEGIPGTWHEQCLKPGA